ncbi:MAG TPA: hypothetical protein VK141_04210 [Nitrosomonas sp.]|nr:hypothetical protein [Nitrosomonas sp.]
MHVSLNTIFCFIFVFLIGTRVEAQTNPVYRDVQNNRKVITKGRREIKPNLTIVESFVDLGYDDTTLARLKEAGADIEKLYAVPKWNNKVRAAISDCIIIGTVIKKEYPWYASHELPFRTIAHVRVDEFLRNDFHVPASDLQVMINSGPDPRGGIWKWVRIHLPWAVNICSS